MGRYFYCYSFRLKDFIKAFGIHYEVRATNRRTGTPYFMFEKSEKLDAVIGLWNQNKAKLDEFDAAPAPKKQKQEVVKLYDRDTKTEREKARQTAAHTPRGGRRT